jgi:GAF domain-containing protein/PAS domain-containing protein
VNVALRLAVSRILVIDDNLAIHQDFRKIFGLSYERADPSEAEKALFGGGEAFGSAPGFQVDSAHQGQEGLALVRLAQEQRNPYAVAFVDVRMPPGWDGVETVARIWEHDADIQIVICTAYSDYSWSEMLDKLGRTDRLVILKKPFDTIEVVQLASALTEKWRLARESRSILEGLERRVEERTSDLRASERRFRSLTVLSSDWFWEQDDEYRFVELSGGDQTGKWGGNQTDSLGLRRWELPGVVPVSASWDEHKAMLHAREQFRDFEYMRLTGEGTLQYLGASGEPVFDAGGRFTGYRGVAIDITKRKEAENRIRRLNRVYAVLSGINTLIVRTHSRQELFREACSIATIAGGFPLAWIGVVDRAAMRVTPVAWRNTDEQFFAAVNMTIREDDPEGLGVVGRAVVTRCPVISMDAENDPAITARGHLEGDARSIAVLPLVVGDVAVGILALHSDVIGFFDQEEMHLLKELAGDIAFAIHNLDRVEKLARLTRVNAMLSGVNGAIVRIRDRDALFQEVCRIAVETGSLPFAWLGVVDASATQLQVVASAGREDGFLETIRQRLALRGDTPDTESLSWRAVRTRHSVVVNDVAADTVLRSRKAFADRGIGSVAVFPLLVAGRVAGAFALHSEQAGFFDDDEMRLLNEVAANISFALEYMEREEKVRRLTRVNAVLSGINEAILHIRDRQELFDESCRIAFEVGGLPLVWLGMVDVLEERLQLRASAGGDPVFLETIGDRLSLRDDAPAGHGVGARSVREERPVAMNDARADAYPRYAKSFAERGIKSIAAFPIIVGGHAVGTFALHAAEADFFDDDEMRLLGEVTGNIAFALEHIDKAQKLARLTRINAILSGINGAIVQMRDRKRLFQEVCRIAVETGGLPFAWLCVVDATGEKLAPVGYAGPDDGFLEMIADRLSLRDDDPNGHGISARSVRERRTIRVGDVAASGSIKHKKPYADRGIKSSAAFPLLIGERVIGSFSLNAAETNFFDNEQVKLLEEVARNIAFALEHIEKEEKVERRIERDYLADRPCRQPRGAVPRGVPHRGRARQVRHVLDRRLRPGDPGGDAGGMGR